MKRGNRYGTHRVLKPAGALPQPADLLDNDFSEIYDNEILVDVLTLNVDAASFTQIKQQAGNDDARIRDIMFGTVRQQGKHRNLVTGSGGMFIGRVNTIGEALRGRIDLAPGDLIASLVSLSLTPLRIDEIVAIRKEVDQVDIRGQAVLFESGVWAKLPADLPRTLALAVLDVAGAPAQTARLVKPNDKVLVIGAAGKSGLLCAYVAKKAAGSGGLVIGAKHSPGGTEVLANAPFVDGWFIGSAIEAADFLDKAEKASGGALFDVVINCVNVEGCEMGAILATRERGICYFFSMATSFTRAALGAEGIGKDIDMIIGNGYAQGHADYALSILRESDYIRQIYQQRYT